MTLEFEDAARLRKFVTDQLFKAREKKSAVVPGLTRDEPITIGRQFVEAGWNSSRT